MKNIKTIPLKFLLLLFVVSGSSFGQNSGTDLFTPKEGDSGTNWFGSLSQKQIYFTKIVSSVRQNLQTSTINKSISFKNDLYVSNFKSDADKVLNNGNETYYTLVVVKNPVVPTSNYQKNDTSTSIPYNFLTNYYVGNNIATASFAIYQYSPCGINFGNALCVNNIIDTITSDPDNLSYRNSWLEIDEDFDGTLNRYSISGN
jgi:hypothetical protein